MAGSSGVCGTTPPPDPLRTPGDRPPATVGPAVPRSRTLPACLALAALLAGCRIDVPRERAAPEGYHRMPDGTLMADVQMQTEYRDLTGSGVEVATHTRPDGTVVLGAAPVPGSHGGGHDHADLPAATSFPQGVAPIALRVARLDLTAAVVATEMSLDRIEGPPVAADLAWLDATRRPGEIGPAVIGGVRSAADEPGALARIDELVVGDELVVVGSEGEQLRFRVEASGPADVAERGAVFRAGDPYAEVRLVAWATGDETQDHVVRARLVEA